MGLTSCYVVLGRMKLRYQDGKRRTEIFHIPGQKNIHHLQRTRIRRDLTPILVTSHFSTIHDVIFSSGSLCRDGFIHWAPETWCITV